jgi:hypothetical protein
LIDAIAAIFFFFFKKKEKNRCILYHRTLVKSLCSSLKTMLELRCPHKLHAEQSSINLMVILSFIPNLFRLVVLVVMIVMTTVLI